MNQNLYAQFEQRFSKDDGGPAMVLPGGRSFTYRQLDAETERYAVFLVSRGARPGDRIAVQVEKSAAAVFLYLGVLRAGCVFVPLDPCGENDESVGCLAEAAPRMLVANRHAAASARRLAALAHVPIVVELHDDEGDELADLSGTPAVPMPVVHRSADDLAIILHGSGTVERQEGVRLTHGKLRAAVQSSHALWDFRASDVLLHILPIFHVHGLAALHCAMWSGMPMRFEPRFDRVRTVALLASSTVCIGTPFDYVRMLGQPGLDAAACRGIRLFISCGAPLRDRTRNLFREVTGHVMVDSYGTAENAVTDSSRSAGAGKKDVVAARGLAAHLNEIEELLDAQPGVGESVVLAYRHAEHGDIVAAIVEPDASVHCTIVPSVPVLTQTLKRILDMPMHSLEMQLVDALPRDAVGAVRRDLLRKRFGPKSNAGEMRDKDQQKEQTT